MHVTSEFAMATQYLLHSRAVAAGILYILPLSWHLSPFSYDQCHRTSCVVISLILSKIQVAIRWSRVVLFL